MKKLTIALMAFTISLGMTSCKEEKKEDMQDEEMMEHSDHDGDHDHEDMDETQLMIGKELTVTLSAKSGSSANGVIEFMQTEEGVVMEADLSGLEPGPHAIHIHQNGDCSAEDGSSAGGHWDPTSEAHGKWGDEMHHSGDIGNLEADEEGNATLTFSTDKWCISCDDDMKNIVGKGVIVHAKADDFTSQPSGAAGARVACGVIE
ncbi:superoxide dismutase family protein [Nonlabens xiamenensis]|uniref:superoxide dismutase family protein n=1 Tax=Nonlabens xiamenensis TaxID=2341043 RepID=UPI000F608DCA|nr:superoxide dismutase family protein [Nonlabens xiamenensis]